MKPSLRSFFRITGFTPRRSAYVLSTRSTASDCNQNIRDFQEATALIARKSYHEFSTATSKVFINQQAQSATFVRDNIPDELRHVRNTPESLPTNAMMTSTLSKGDHYFDTNDVRFHYKVGGSGPLLVAHSVGWGMPGSYLWNGLGPHLEKTHTVVYLEPRGNGQTSKPSDEASMSSKVMAEDIEQLRIHLGVEVIPALLGHSNGACIILRYAEVHPERVEKLILIDAEIHDSPPNDSFQQWVVKRKDDPVYSEALTTLAGAMQSPPDTDKGFSEMMQKILPWYFSDPSHVSTLQSHIDAEVTPPGVWAFLRQSKVDREPENRLPHIADAAKVTAKTLILWGKQDAMCSLTAAQAVADGIPSAKLVLLEDVGHMPWIEKPSEFWTAVDNFL